MIIFKRDILLIVLFAWFTAASISAQESRFDYQIILETKGAYNNIDQESKINFENRMKLDEFSSLSQLYPILGFKNT